MHYAIFGPASRLDRGRIRNRSGPPSHLSIPYVAEAACESHLARQELWCSSSRSSASWRAASPDCAGLPPRPRLRTARAPMPRWPTSSRRTEPPCSSTSVPSAPAGVISPKRTRGTRRRARRPDSDKGQAEDQARQARLRHVRPRARDDHVALRRSPSLCASISTTARRRRAGSARGRRLLLRRRRSVRRSCRRPPPTRIPWRAACRSAPLSTCPSSAARSAWT